jgi:hypothetical protein
MGSSRNPASRPTGRETWFGKLWKRLKGGIVADVPPSLDACETCREVDCTQERWSTCPPRLEVEAIRLKESGSPLHAAGSTHEPAGGSSHGCEDAKHDANQPVESGEKQRSISRPVPKSDP